MTYIPLTLVLFVTQYLSEALSWITFLTAVIKHLIGSNSRFKEVWPITAALAAFAAGL